jgi:hypothetical protein
MEELRARSVVDALRDRGVDAHLLRVGVDQFGVRVSLPGGREAEWDSDGTAGLEAQVMLDGDLVGYVPEIEGSEDFDEAQIVDAIIRTDYDQPIASQRAAAPPEAPPLTREGGVFRRFLDGFRYGNDSRLARCISARSARSAPRPSRACRTWSSRRPVSPRHS